MFRAWFGNFFVVEVGIGGGHYTINGCIGFQASSHQTSFYRGTGADEAPAAKEKARVAKKSSQSNETWPKAQ